MLEKKPEDDDTENYHYTGYIIHHEKDRNGKYCGWLYRKQTVGVRTSDLNNHLKRCSPGCLRGSAVVSEEVKSKQTKIK